MGTNQHKSLKNKGTGTVIVSTPDATATYTATSVTVAPKHSNVILGGSNVTGGGGGLTYTTGTGTQPTWAVNNAVGTMHAKDLMLDGVSLKQLLEDRLNLMIPNPSLEKEWDQLKALGDEYRKLEADLKEKGRIWQALNKKS